jgi:hypothetical protein
MRLRKEGVGAIALDVLVDGLSWSHSYKAIRPDSVTSKRPRTILWTSTPCAKHGGACRYNERNSEPAAVSGTSKWEIQVCNHAPSHSNNSWLISKTP